MILFQRYFLFHFSDAFRTSLASFSGNRESWDGVHSVNSISTKQQLPFRTPACLPGVQETAVLSTFLVIATQWKINLLYLTALEREVSNPNLQMNKVRSAAT